MRPRVGSSISWRIPSARVCGWSMNSWRLITGAQGTSASRRMLSHWSRGRVRMIGSMMSLSACRCSAGNSPRRIFEARVADQIRALDCNREFAPEGRVAARGEQVLAVSRFEQAINRNRAERILRRRDTGWSFSRDAGSRRSGARARRPEAKPRRPAPLAIRAARDGARRPPRSRRALPPNNSPREKPARRDCRCAPIGCR